MRFEISKVSMKDVDELMEVFRGSVSTVCKNDYSPLQISAWLEAAANKDKWINRINSQYFIKAENGDGILGFGSLQNNDYIDLLYVHKDFQRKGIAGEIFRHLEAVALKNGSSLLKSDVSKTARQFFLNTGFKVVSENVQRIGNVDIANYTMIKMLR
ncbi:MAG: GNAT family N-acetyltransferase [Bacteroidales bacterium]